MSAADDFRVLLEKVRAGDQAAAAELVRQYEPEIRRLVRLRLTDPSLRRVLDSMDICQSVMANFFVRAAAGQFELNQPEHLLKLLVTMARNKIRDKARRQHAGRRDQRRVQGDGGEHLDSVPASDFSPSRILTGRELLEAVRGQMTDEERRLADGRAAGREWSEIAVEVGGSPDALRKQLARGLDRIMRNLGLDEVDHA
jgi:RNA polymerase sigma-70 factor (ECF subfamily)